MPKNTISLKNTKDIILLQEGGKRLAKVMDVLQRETKPGVSAAFLDKLAFKLIKQYGGRPSFLNYQADYSDKPFLNSLCVSLNDVIVHGTPRQEIIFQPGDLVSLDIGMEYKGLFTDMAITIGLAGVTKEDKQLVQTTKDALDAAIRTARCGKTLGDIGYAIQNQVEKNGLAIIRDLVGHGVGYAVHEEPPVFNYGERGRGLILESGLVLAIEPMVTSGAGGIKKLSDGSFATLTGQRACHFEHTIAILADQTIILTR